MTFKDKGNSLLIFTFGKLPSQAFSQHGCINKGLEYVRLLLLFLFLSFFFWQKAVDRLIKEGKFSIWSHAGRNESTELRFRERDFLTEASSKCDIEI